MPKYKVRWSEVSTYETVIESPLPIDMLNGTDADADPDHWFDLVDQQVPGWFEHDLVEVNDRTLDDIEEVKEYTKS